MNCSSLIKLHMINISTLDLAEIIAYQGIILSVIIRLYQTKPNLVRCLTFLFLYLPDTGFAAD